MTPSAEQGTQQNNTGYAMDTSEGKYYRGGVADPNGQKRTIVIRKAVKALATRIAKTEARRVGGTWFVEPLDAAIETTDDSPPEVSVGP